MFQRLMSQITAVKKDMVILEKSEFSALLAENEVGALLHPLVLILIYVLSGSPPLGLSAEAQDPAPETQGPAGRTWLSWNPVQSCVSTWWIRPHPSHPSVLQDLMSKVRSDILLDMNVEKSRVKEMVPV